MGRFGLKTGALDTWRAVSAVESSWTASRSAKVKDQEALIIYHRSSDVYSLNTSVRSHTQSQWGVKVSCRTFTYPTDAHASPSCAVGSGLEWGRLRGGAVRRALPGFGRTDPARGARFPLDGSDAQPRRLTERREKPERRSARRVSCFFFCSLSFPRLISSGEYIHTYILIQPYWSDWFTFPP